MYFLIKDKDINLSWGMYNLTEIPMGVDFLKVLFENKYLCSASFT